MEQEISAAYLEKIQQAYFEYFHTQDQFPILILELEDADFVAEPEYYDVIHRLLRKEYLKGLHRVDIKQQ